MATITQPTKTAEMMIYSPSPRTLMSTIHHHISPHNFTHFHILFL